MKHLTLSNIDEIVRQGNFIYLSPCPEHYNLFILQEDVHITLSDKTELIVKKGFLYDGASVPWIFEPFFPKWGIYSIGAFVHDILYYSKKKSRHFADMEYKRWMWATKVKDLQISLRYYVVVLFGWILWLKGKYKPSKILKHNFKHILWKEN